MIPKNNKGFALIVVIMVMAIMTILGTAILNISLSETKQASYEDKRLQAHYLARSGAEATLSAWEDAAIGSKPSGGCSPVYLNNLNEFDDDSTNMIGKFEVTVTNPDSVTTRIASVGTVGNVQQTVTVTIKEGTTTETIPSLGTVAGEALGWYSYNSGQINTGVNIPGPSGKVVILKSKDGLKIPNKNSPSATFVADQMRFISEVQILHNSIILRTKLIAFDSSVNFSNNSKGSGALVFEVLDGGYIPNNSSLTGTVGVVFFGNVGYYFKDGVILKKPSDIQSQVAAHKLELILATDPNFINPFLSAPTQTIISYTNTWS